MQQPQHPEQFFLDQTQAGPLVPPPGLLPPPPPPKKKKRRIGCVLGVIGAVVLGLCGLLSVVAVTVTPPQTTPSAPVAVQVTRGTQAPPATPSPVLTPSPTPTRQPTQPPTPTQLPTPTQPPRPPTPPPSPVPSGPVYNFDPVGGELVYDPPADWCVTHACVSTFWTATNGYVVQCGDGKYSHSGGVKGVCSRNGGVAHILYRHKAG